MKKSVQDTKCWSCARALGGCSWTSGKFIPVRGWSAIRTKIKSQKMEDCYSYVVIECPLYERG